MARSAAALATALALLAVGPVTHAQQVRQWTASNGDFNDSGNWNGSVPGENNIARFNQDATYTVTFDISPDNRALEQTAGTVTFISDDVERQNYTLIGSGEPPTPSLLSGGSLTLGASGNPLDVNFQGHLHVNGGQLNVFHGSQVEVNNFSKFASEGTTGVIHVAGGGSAFDVFGGNDVRIGNDGGTGTLTYSDGASGSFDTELRVGTGSNADTSGTLNVLSGSTFAVQESLLIGLAAGTGVVNVQDAGSLLTATGSEIRIGSDEPGDNPGTLNVGTTGSGRHRHHRHRRYQDPRDRRPQHRQRHHQRHVQRQRRCGGHGRVNHPHGRRIQPCRRARLGGHRWRPD